LYVNAGNWKVMVFGIARDMAASPSTATRIGTPIYQSPESLKGAPLTPASDIYSAGVVFYELLTGKKPFRKGTLRERMLKPVPRVSKVMRGIPRYLDEMVYRCLQIRPEDRFQSVQELIASISERHSRIAATGMLSDLIQDDPPSVVDVLPIFLRTVQRLVVIHADSSLRPVMTPDTIRWSPNEIQIRTVSTAQEQQTRAVDCKYLSFEHLNESAVSTNIGPASDIYVLGFIFYEILLGQRLFRFSFGDVYQGDSDFQWLNWHSDPEKRAAPLGEVLAGCPSMLSEIIESMMQKSAERRPDIATVEKTFGKLLDELTRNRGGATRIARRRARERRKKVFASAKRFVRSALIAIVTVAMGGGFLAAIGWLLWKQLEVPPPAVIEPTKIAVPATAQAVPTTAQASPDPLLPRTVDTGTGLMVLIPETEFEMGNDGGRLNEAPRHAVKVPTFYIDKHEVTNREYKEFCDATGRKYPANPPWDSRYFDKPDYPVINVSWNDARAYASWAGKRIPTEAEWELAARGPTGTLFPWGNDFQKDAANLAGAADGYEYTAPVGSFRLDVSPFGVMDMAGNVSEWIEDRYTLYSGSRLELPHNQRSHQVVRGGSMDQDPDNARLTTRNSHPSTPSPGLGFRCAADVQTILNALLKQLK
jgi:sulfatase modifying factor 1